MNQTATTTRAAALRSGAESLAASLPPLLAAAERLAQGVVPGVHGRRRAGSGETFWQYRQAMPGDSAASIDWRRSARGDTLYIRQTEWEAAQSVLFWADPSAGMGFASADHPPKSSRARLLALALGVLLTRAGERIGLLDTPLARPSAGRNQLNRFAASLAEKLRTDDVAALPEPGPITAGHYVLVSDFMMDEAGLRAGLNAMAARGTRGALLQITDPAEEAFPYDGRVIFQSLAGAVSFETRRARALKSAYQERLAARRALLADWAHHAGWQFTTHRTDTAPSAPLLWLYAAIGGLT
ncbi:DUF58 domain-containing protein [Abyssibius alkaniclasticus]|uniref:DUF58 domain-containing protein n=1 Tax=Abyssibius alkaniclasticus TaxID=2881234 RepID=UPI004058E3E5